MDIVVGFFTTEYKEILSSDLPTTEILQTPGLAKHIKKRHPEMMRNIHLIPDIVNDPDYIGHNPRHPDSAEFVKAYDENILVALTLDHRSGTLHVSSMYGITLSKLQNMIKTGRLISLK